MNIGKIYISRTYFLYSILAILFVIVAYGYFVGFFTHGYVVPFGDDPVRHITNAMEFQENGFALTKDGELDPPFIRIIFSVFADLAGIEVYQFVTYFMPFVVIAIIFSSYVFAKNIFGRRDVGVLSVMFFAFISPQPGNIYDEGTFMNLIAALLIFPLFVLFYTKAFSNKSYKAFLYSAMLLGVGIMGYHSLTSIYLFLFLLCATLAIALSWNKKLIQRQIVFLLIVGVVGSFIAFKFFVERTLLFLLSKIGATPVPSDEVLGGISNDPAGILANFDAFSHNFGFFILIFGVLGIVLYLFRDKSARLQKVILLSWPVALYIGSQIELLPLSQRFARDIIYSFVVFSAFFIVKYLHSKSMLYKSMGFVAISCMFILSTSHFVEGKSRYNSLMRVASVDLEAFEWVEENIKKDSPILATSGVVNGGWGSYAHIITGRNFLDGGRCDDALRIEDNKCEFIYNPTSSASQKYYIEHGIEYIYSHRNIEPAHFLYGKIDYSYRKEFENTPFLQEITRFKSKFHGETVIYRINKDLLL